MDHEAAKASSAPTLEALGFGDASAHSHPTQAMKRRCSSKEKASVLQVGCGEATRARGMQAMEQRGWEVSHHSRPGPACCKPGGRDFFFSQLVSYAGAGGGQEEEQVAILGLGKAEELGKGRKHKRGNPQGHLLQSTQSH